MGVEDKEYPVKVTDEMILKYEKMVHKVYNKIYGKSYDHFKDDLLQCGRWGVFLAYQRYERKQLQDIVSFNVYTWLHIRNKMYQYIDHEKHHINKETNNYDFESEPSIPNTSWAVRLDIEKALNDLPHTEHTQILQWANYIEFKNMGFTSRQVAHKRFKRILTKLKEKLQ